MNKHMTWLAVATIALVPMVCMAGQTPKPGKYDARIKHVIYNAQDVVRIIGHYGYSTHIEFAQGEKIENVALGDSLAWEVAPIGNDLFVKPREPKATTNMTVLTNKRVYNFILTANKEKSPHNHNLFFQVTFRYPAQKAAKAQAAALAEAREKAARQTKKMLAVTAHNPRNWDYYARGDDAVTPTMVWDDGTYTYMEFAGNRDMPAVFVVDGADGTKGEALVNTHVEECTLAQPTECPRDTGVTGGSTIVVHRTAPKFILRRGQLVAAIINKSYDPAGVANRTGTFSPHVRRIIKKGANQ